MSPTSSSVTIAIEGQILHHGPDPGFPSQALHSEPQNL